MKYFVKVEGFPEQEVSKQTYIAAEANAGFYPKTQGEIATASFSNGTISGTSTMKMKCPKKTKGECKATGSGCAHAIKHKPSKWCGISDKPCPTCVPAPDKER